VKAKGSYDLFYPDECFFYLQRSGPAAYKARFEVPLSGIDIYPKYLEEDHLNCKRHKGYDLALVIAYTRDKFDY